MCDNGALVIAAMGFASEKIVKIAPMTMPIWLLGTESWTVEKYKIEPTELHMPYPNHEMTTPTIPNTSLFWRLNKPINRIISPCSRRKYGKFLAVNVFLPLCLTLTANAPRIEPTVKDKSIELYIYVKPEKTSIDSLGINNHTVQKQKLVTSATGTITEIRKFFRIIFMPTKNLLVSFVTSDVTSTFFPAFVSVLNRVIRR